MLRIILSKIPPIHSRALKFLTAVPHRHPTHHRQCVTYTHKHTSTPYASIFFINLFPLFRLYKNHNSPINPHSKNLQEHHNHELLQSRPAPSWRSSSTRISTRRVPERCLPTSRLPATGIPSARVSATRISTAVCAAVRCSASSAAAATKYRFHGRLVITKFPLFSVSFYACNCQFGLSKDRI